MKQLQVHQWIKWLKKCSLSCLGSFLGGVVFYTSLPLPSSWSLHFERIARWAPVIGCALGAGLTLINFGLGVLGVPDLTRSVVLVVLWLQLTNGLHLDGAMDTADGLAVLTPNRRLEVMQDSHTGAFGVMVGVIILLLKTVALYDLSRGDLPLLWGLMGAAGWGRWGQVCAIAFYPYLKPTGKGAFHKQYFRSPQDLLIGFLVLVGLGLLQIYLNREKWLGVLICTIAGMGLALFTGWWFNRKLGGHTGDTYGAVVEWTEAGFLVLLTGMGLTE
ncbi:adenosylcobinamide-GDP ribazoletransferase [Spirulina subsalsa]|uniref:adenosylcobinamide-GDP ribazoletransferase n=1 Tax=Spirulina subsalsa TaxID=54311 RepID=UPI00030270BC|nr:adenosylcobinamide-GDP ribazoletransferase [Spirulina subsalsa]